MSYRFGAWKPYVPVAKRRAQAARQGKKLIKDGHVLEPVRLPGRTIASSFWGKGWCAHLEAFSDFENRLPRGRTYVRNGSVWHLAIKTGRIEAQVMGSSLYRVTVETRPLKPATWTAIKQTCSGEIGSVLELLQGMLSEHVMRAVTDRTFGLFPQPGEMTFECSCPDWATMCKHVAAVLYGVGSRLDQQPHLLFLLRGVDAGDLIGANLTLPKAATQKDRLADDQLGALFGIELESGTHTAPEAIRRQESVSSASQKQAPRGRDKDPRQNNAAARDFQATGRAVATLRETHGMSVSKFAKHLSVSAASVQRWEATRGNLKLHRRCLEGLSKLQRKAPVAKKRILSRFVPS